MGIDTLAYDRMGWGQSPGDGGELSSLHDVYDELCSLIYILRERYDRIHLVGLSWGGLYLLYAAKHLSPIVNSVIAISPGIYLRKAFGMTTAWESLKNLYFERQWRFELLYQPHDFSQIDKQIKYIENDPFRIQKIGPRFIAATALMQGVLKSRLYRSTSPASMVPQVVLASQDQIVDTQKTLELCEELEFGFRTIAGGHSLVLDAPDELALQIAKMGNNLTDSETNSFKKTS
jgi:pimeloyl-ACP methyl ester carboxylesterase